MSTHLRGLVGRFKLDNEAVRRTGAYSGSGAVASKEKTAEGEEFETELAVK